MYSSNLQILSVSLFSSSIVLAILLSKSSSTALFCSIWSSHVFSVMIWSDVIDLVDSVIAVTLPRVLVTWPGSVTLVGGLEVMQFIHRAATFVSQNDVNWCHRNFHGAKDIGISMA